MMVILNNRNERAFTLPEVALAIGVIALGLVGVFSILPFGLTAQKNNQEETIIRYEAQCWHELLLSDGLLFEDVDQRVDRVEVYNEDASVTHTFINPFRRRPDPQDSARKIVRYEENATGRTPYSYPASSLSLFKAKKYWSSDVQGWLLNPVSESGPEGNFALVRSINGSLFDRFYGAEPERDDYYFPNRDFSTGYILQIQPESTATGPKIKMTFYWPLFEEVLEKLEPKPPTAGGQINTIKSVVVNSMSPDSVIKFKTKSFTIKVPGTIEKALTEDMLNPQERRFMREISVLQPGERIDLDDHRLESIFKDNKFLGLDPNGQPQNWESVLRQYAKDESPGGRYNLVKDEGGHYALARRLRMTIHRPAAVDESATMNPDVDVPRLWRVVQ